MRCEGASHVITWVEIEMLGQETPKRKGTEVRVLWEGHDGCCILSGTTRT